MKSAPVSLASAPKKPRKRECLVGMSPDQKLQRRKITNRMSAQAARDRKKDYIANLQEEMKRLIKQNNELRASSSKLEMTLRMERHTNSQLRLRAAEETCGSIVQIGMPSYRGDIAAPPPVVADELEIESGVYEEELVALESAALGASQPKKRSATPTSSQFKSVVLMLAALSCLANPTVALNPETSVMLTPTLSLKPVTPMHIPLPLTKLTSSQENHYLTHCWQVSTIMIRMILFDVLTSLTYYPPTKRLPLERTLTSSYPPHPRMPSRLTVSSTLQPPVIQRRCQTV